MEGVSANAYKGLRGYWRRRGYEKLNRAGRRRKATRVELPAAGANRSRRFWRIKIAPKLKLKFRFSPKKFFIGLRDAYVNMMLKIANSGVGSSGIGGFGGDGIAAFGRAPRKEYDERMIVELYKSLVLAKAQLVAGDATRIGTEIVCYR
ncbi:unnamed protein product [Ilex paraguariensis]|uniref:Uncharacterized protein n=1 Tax=Ilex paraguariensis TaxID=185542 RepID=A0ABC8QQR9_9AQUA